VVCDNAEAQGSSLIVLLMGVSGAGKTTVGRLLASTLGWEFADGDDYHSAANIEKMRAGIPLTDEDREPWIQTLRTLMRKWIDCKQSGVLACSALKEAYRAQLVLSPEIRVVYLKADREVLRQRLLRRVGHYMREPMLESQLATLEEPRDALVIDAAEPEEEIVQDIKKSL
jgi:gluconokinase